MKIDFFLIFVLLTGLSACKQRPVMRQGTIQLELYVYNDPGGDLYNSCRVPVSTLYFYRNCFLEKLPVEAVRQNLPAFVLIRDSLFMPLESLLPPGNNDLAYPLRAKSFGAGFLRRNHPGYESRKQLTDTTITGVQYQRFELITPSEYSIFYLHPTDTLVPYGLSGQFECDYAGFVQRIDSYEFHGGRFLSLRMQLSPDIPKTYYQFLKGLQ